MKKIILASQSPRRKQILEQIGLNFIVEASNYKEEIINIKPQKLVEILSIGKAEAVSKNHKDAIIIGSDTIVVLENEVLGKPKTKIEAGKMLTKLSGKSHFVYTGYAVIDTNKNKTISGFVKTKVKFKNLSKDEINGYVNTGEPMDKAGAYGIQERAAIFVESIEGDYTSVVGLPLIVITKALEKFGIKISDSWKKTDVKKVKQALLE